MSNIDEIVNVNISIESPESSGESFSGLLLVLSKPTNDGDLDMDGVVPITKASDLADYGFATDSDDYKAATVAFSQNPRPTSVYAILRQTTGSNDSLKNEDIATTLDRASAETGWYGLYIVTASDTDIAAAATWCESANKLFGVDWDGTISDSNLPVDNSHYHTFVMYSNATGDNAKFGALAMMAKCFGYEPGAEQWAHKTLSSIPASTITTAQATALEKLNSNFYRTIGGGNYTFAGKVVAGEWIDTIRFRDWLVSRIQTKVFNFLTSNAKVPYNDNGITGIQGKIEEVLAQAQKTGGIDADQTDEDGNVTKGYTVTVPKSSDISAEQKAKRQVTDIKFSARLAGAIILANIEGTLTY